MKPKAFQKSVIGIIAFQMLLMNIVFSQGYYIHQKVPIHTEIVQHETCDNHDGIARVVLPDLASNYILKWTYPNGQVSTENTITNLEHGTYNVEVRAALCPDKVIYSGSVVVKQICDDKPIVQIITESAYSYCSSSWMVLSSSARGGQPFSAPPHYQFGWQTKIISGSGTHVVTNYAIDSLGKIGTASETIYIKEIECSQDPNEITGPQGYGEDLMVNTFDKMPFTIQFENDPDFATAPASRVSVYYPVPPQQNISSFRLSDFGFGSFIFTLPPNATSYYQRLNVADSLGVWVDVTAGIDIVNNQIFWIFQSIDPTTGFEPQNSQLGFLLINDSLSRGEGYVSFFINPNNNLHTGDTVAAKASIVFDDNAPIATNVWNNTFDAVAPVSTIDSMITFDNDSLNAQISFIASDDAGGSGINHLEIFISQNNGAYQSMGVIHPDSAFNLFLENGFIYNIISIATDNVGNVEPFKNVPDYVIDYNMAPTDILLSHHYFYENAPMQTLIGTFSTIDNNDESFSYQFIEDDDHSTDNQYFTINNDKLLTNFNFNCYDQLYYTIKVRSTDISGQYVEKTFELVMGETNSSYDIQLTGSVCQGELYNRNGLIINTEDSTSGTHTYRQNFITRSGCDSIITLTLTIYPTYNQTETETICDNELPFTWRDTTFEVGSTSGMYIFNRQTITGCDSIVNLTLTVHPTYSYEEIGETCDNVPYVWNNHNDNIGLLSAGTHIIWDSLQTANNCDSIYKLTLTVHPTYYNEQTAETCDNVPYVWNNHNVNIGLLSAGTHIIWDSLQTANNCDSIYKLTLTVHPTYSYEEIGETCENVPYVWNNHNVNIGLLSAGTHIIWDSLQTANNCDSIYKLTLTVHPTYSYEQTGETCENVPYVWSGHAVNIGLLSDGTHIIWDSLQTVNGCDSVYKLTLTVHPTYNYEETGETCDNVPYVWNNHNVNIGLLTAGTYTYWDSLQTANNCDSIYKLTLTVHPTYSYEEIGETCDNVPYVWSGHAVNIDLLSAGTHIIWDSLQTANNCDSIYKLTLTVHPTYSYEQTGETCENVPYVWSGHAVNIGLLTAGTHIIWDSLQTVNGCDSVYKLTFTVHPTYNYEETGETCDNVPYVWNNHNVNIGLLTAGTYTYWDSLQTANNCDSIYKLTLTVHPTYSYEEIGETCDNVPYVWSGHAVNIDLLSAGTHIIWDSLQTANNCDSIYKLTLTVHPTYSYEQTGETCENVPYVWSGHAVNIGLLTAGTHIIWDSLQTVNGCDSVYKLTFTVHPTYNYEETGETCDNVPYVWNNHNVNIGLLTAGTYTYWDSLQTANNCDSIYKLTLTVHPTYSYEEIGETCENVPYVWNNHNVNIGLLSAGTHIIWDSLQTANNCDSIYKLTLTVHPTYSYEQTGETCENVPYVWSGHAVNIGLLTAGTHIIWDSLQTMNGCDSVYKLSLNVHPTYHIEINDQICQGEPYNAYGFDIPADSTQTAGVIEETVHAVSLQTGCDSVVILHLTINPTYYYEQTAETCDNVPYVWNNHNVNIGLLSVGTHIIWDSLQTINGCDSVYKLLLTVHPTYHLEINDQICQGEPYNAHGFDIPADSTQTAGVLEKTLHAVSLQTGCDSVVTLYLTITPLPIITINGDTDISQGESTTLTAEGAESYLWNTGDITPSIVVAPEITTQYSVTGTDSYGCVGNASVEVTVSVGIRDVETDNYPSLQIYPNPANTYITLLTTDNANITNVTIMDVMGRMVMRNDGTTAEVTDHNLSLQSRSIDVSILTSGTYFVQVTIDGNNVVTKKLVIAR